MKINNLEKDINQLKYLICKMCLIAQSGHPSSSLSCSEIIGSLYLKLMDLDSDKFILSKGHASPSLYSALMMIDKIPKDLINNLRNIDSPLQGHPDVTRLKDVNVTTGALGQGLSFAIGLAIGKKIKKEKGNIFCLIGDGEMQEGQIWEALMFAGNNDLPNLITFLDFNKGQSDGKVEQIMNISPIDKKLEAFGWEVKEIDGHSLSEIENTVKEKLSKKDGKPLFIISNTKKGYVSPNLTILDGNHGASINDEIMNKVIEELEISKRWKLQETFLGIIY